MHLVNARLLGERHCRGPVIAAEHGEVETHSAEAGYGCSCFRAELVANRDKAKQFVINFDKDYCRAPGLCVRYVRRERPWLDEPRPPKSHAPAIERPDDSVAHHGADISGVCNVPARRLDDGPRERMFRCETRRRRLRGPARFRSDLVQATRGSPAGARG